MIQATSTAMATASFALIGGIGFSAFQIGQSLEPQLQLKPNAFGWISQIRFDTARPFAKAPITSQDVLSLDLQNHDGHLSLYTGHLKEQKRLKRIAAIKSRAKLRARRLETKRVALYQPTLPLQVSQSMPQLSESQIMLNALKTMRRHYTVAINQSFPQVPPLLLAKKSIQNPNVKTASLPNLRPNPYTYRDGSFAGPRKVTTQKSKLLKPQSVKVRVKNNRLDNLKFPKANEGVRIAQLAKTRNLNTQIDAQSFQLRPRMDIQKSLDDGIRESGGDAEDDPDEIISQDLNANPLLSDPRVQALMPKAKPMFASQAMPTRPNKIDRRPAFPARDQMSNQDQDLTQCASDDLNTQFVLPFNESLLVQADRTTALTQEGSQMIRQPGKLSQVFHCRQAKWHWRKAEINDHLPTLYRTFGQMKARIPSFSSNAIAILEQRIKTKIHPELGIVFGKLPRGWQVDLASSGADASIISQKVYFDSNGVLVEGAAAIKRATHFAFFNVIAGYPLLYLRNDLQKPAIGGAIALPVASGQVTYIDTLRYEVQDVEGHVLSAVEPFGAALGKVYVHLFGHPQAGTVSDFDGMFRFKRVVVFKGFPLHFETKAMEENREQDDSGVPQEEFIKGFDHRYQVSIEPGSELILYRFASHFVLEEWLAQLGVGGIDSSSGLALSAFPQLITKFSESLFQKVVPVEVRSKLTPESYSIDLDETLNAKKALNLKSPRALTAQLPEGLNQIVLENNSGSPQWSQFFMASPGVINMVGPY